MEQGEVSDARVYFRKAVAARANYAEALASLLFSRQLHDRRPARIEAARDYGRMVDDRVRSRYTASLNPLSAKRLRVGLVSADLRNHPSAFF